MPNVHNIWHIQALVLMLLGGVSTPHFSSLISQFSYLISQNWWAPRITTLFGLISLTHFLVFWVNNPKTKWRENVIFKTPELSFSGKVVNTWWSCGAHDRVLSHQKWIPTFSPNDYMPLLPLHSLITLSLEHYLTTRGISVIFKVYGVFWSFFRFRKHFGHFLGF